MGCSSSKTKDPVVDDAKKPSRDDSESVKTHSMTTTKTVSKTMSDVSYSERPPAATPANSASTVCAVDDVELVNQQVDNSETGLTEGQTDAAASPGDDEAIAFVEKAIESALALYEAEARQKLEDARRELAKSFGGRCRDPRATDMEDEEVAEAKEAGTVEAAKTLLARAFEARNVDARATDMGDEALLLAKEVAKQSRQADAADAAKLSPTLTKRSLVCSE